MNGNVAANSQVKVEELELSLEENEPRVNLNQSPKQSVKSDTSESKAKLDEPVEEKAEEKKTEDKKP